MDHALIDPVFPSEQDSLRAEALRDALRRREFANAPLRVQVDDESVVDLPAIVARLLVNILDETAAGHAIALLPMDADQEMKHKMLDEMAAIDQELGLI